MRTPFLLCGGKMGKYFGTDGFRGETNKNLRAEHAVKIGQILGWYYRHRCDKEDTKKVRVIIGRDTRRSGNLLEAGLICGLTEMGADVYTLGITTTPSVAYLAKEDGFDCGIMISASHNPFYDNGIKLINGNGEKMSESVIEIIESYIDDDVSLLGISKDEFVPAVREQIGCVYDYTQGRERYTRYLTEQGMDLSGMRIGLDCANGSAYQIAKDVFRALGAEITVINDAPNGLNINRDAGSTHIDGLMKLVSENNLDAGFAFDGDADRCLCVDEKGQLVDGDLILYIYGRYLQSHGRLANNTIVTTVMSNFGLYKALDEAEISYAKTAVGDKYVYEYMVNHDCCLGGEQSGHIIFRDIAKTGDGILTALKMLEVITSSQKAFSQLAAPVTIYPQVLMNVKVKDKALAKADEAVQSAVKDVAEHLGNDGRILVRESGTEPLLRVMVEAKSTDECRVLAEQVVQVIRRQGHEREQ